jgi:hypothetical protein
LRRLQIDDVKNSEYIEEEEIKRFSMAQRSQLFRESNVIVTDENVIFKLIGDGGTGGLDDVKNMMNRSHDFNDDRGQSTAELRNGSLPVHRSISKQSKK